MTTPIPLSNPNLTLERVTDVTVSEWMRITNEIFSAPLSNGDPPFLAIFYPQGRTPAIEAWATSVHQSSIHKPDNHYCIIRDVSLPDAPCVATARFVDVPRSTPESRAQADAEAAQQRAEDAANPVPGVDYRVYDHFRPAQMGGVDRVVGDRAHTYLKILAVVPERQGQGVGKAVLRYVCERARERGEPVYLEASGFGVPAYLKSGFKDCGFIDFDATRFGAEHAHKHLAMIWEPEENPV